MRIVRIVKHVTAASTARPSVRVSAGCIWRFEGACRQPHLMCNIHKCCASPTHHGLRMLSLPMNCTVQFTPDRPHRFHLLQGVLNGIEVDNYYFAYVCQKPR